MAHERSLRFAALDSLPPIPDADGVARLEAGRDRRALVIVLDDDPTGVQTVHDVPVYTVWDRAAFDDAFASEERMAFFLTNSRSFTATETEAVHAAIGRSIAEASRAAGRDFIVMSRGDSTLRGHYPLETETLARALEAAGAGAFDGEVICPYFGEGGRYTVGGVHYARDGGLLVPVGLTEFARDRTFGYAASRLDEWVEEKTAGRFKASDCALVPIERLRALDLDWLDETLAGVGGFRKVIVDAADDSDVRVMAIALDRARAAGRRFMIRGAAAMAKALGGVGDRPLLSREELLGEGASDGGGASRGGGASVGGVVVVGSHTAKTTRQLAALRASRPHMEFALFDSNLVLEDGGLANEVERVVALCDAAIAAGKSVVVYTRRELLAPDGMDKERQLLMAVAISEALTSIVARLSVRPRFVVAKGGITSSDVGVKALCVKKARVMGQAAPGVPVWMTGDESRFPGLPYVIFPGNVGDDDTLAFVVEKLV